jgi:hypothetical protein
VLLQLGAGSLQLIRELDQLKRVLLQIEKVLLQMGDGSLQTIRESDHLEQQLPEMGAGPLQSFLPSRSLLDPLAPFRRNVIMDWRARTRDFGPFHACHSLAAFQGSFEVSHGSKSNLDCVWK